MIVGLGTDLVEIARIKHAMKNPRFIERILTEAEREICTTPERVAGRWAAKEAIAKAVGLHLTWQQVEILPDELGSPRAMIDSAYFDRRRLKLHVSITHERTHAMAVAILERTLVKAPLL
jgi:holo-[acyl-carrier protein] synthase